jgi:putative DNA primase/helicase
LHGKILNSAGDLSDRHVEDLSLFKTLTGDDTVSAELKFRDAFVFRNTALFMFNANVPPTVAEGSRAYLARVRPFLFPYSFEGQERPEIEAGIMEELPGVLVRLVEGVQRWHARGGYAPVNPIVGDLFGRQSDPVAMFIAQVLAPSESEFVSTKDLHESYRLWTAANNRGTLGRNKMLARAENHLGPRERERRDGTGSRGWRGWRLLPESQWVDDDATYAGCADSIHVSATSATSSFTSPYETVSGKEPESECVPREREIGPEAAEVADDDPDERIEVVL